jgi:hypothetical protein
MSLLPSIAVLKEESGVSLRVVNQKSRSYFQGISPKARQLIDLPKSWKRWATVDEEIRLDNGVLVA